MSRGKIFYQPWRKKCRYQYDENNKYFEKKMLKNEFQSQKEGIESFKTSLLSKEKYFIR